MRFEKTEHDFGTIKAGETYTVVFTQSDDDDVSKYVGANVYNGGCGCTQAKYSPRDRTFTVGINRSQKGTFEKHPHIQWLDSETLEERKLVFTIKGNVV